MKRLRILHGTASLIALTASLGFVNGPRETDSELALCEKSIATRILHHLPGGTAGLGTPILEDSSTYMIDIEQAGHSKIILVDALTGSVLKA